MKLTYCRLCGDIFNLRHDPKSCGCGNVTAYYLDDGIQAEYYVKSPGTAWPLGITNQIFSAQLRQEERRISHTQKWGGRFEAFFIPLLTNTIKIFQTPEKVLFQDGNTYTSECRESCNSE